MTMASLECVVANDDPFDAGPSPWNSSVSVEKRRSPPSSCAGDDLKILAIVGQGWSSGPFVGRSVQDLDLHDGARALTVHGAETVGAGVAAAQDDDVQVLGVDRWPSARRRAPRDWPPRDRSWPDRRPRAPRPAPGSVAVASNRARAARRRSRAAGRASGVAASPIVTPAWKVDAGGLHDGEATIEDRLFQFELGYAVAQQSADGVAAFEDVDVVTDARELGRRGESGRSGADDGDALAGAGLGHARDVEAVGEGVLGDLVLDAFDRDRDCPRCPTRRPTHTARGRVGQ